MNHCHKQSLRIVDDNRSTSYDQLVQQLRVLQKKDADPFFPWICSMCESELCFKDGLIPNICLGKYNVDGSHRICSICWWSGKNGREAFASEGGSHGCPGCKKEWPRADRIWIRKTNRKQARHTKSGDVTEESYR